MRAIASPGGSFRHTNELKQAATLCQNIKTQTEFNPTVHTQVGGQCLSDWTKCSLKDVHLCPSGPRLLSAMLGVLKTTMFANYGGGHKGCSTRYTRGTGKVRVHVFATKFRNCQNISVKAVDRIVLVYSCRVVYHTMCLIRSPKYQP